MSVKRASYVLPPETVDRAKQLRREGRSFRDIVRTLAKEGMKASRAALGDYFNADPTCHTSQIVAASAAADAADEDTVTLELEDAVEESIRVYRGLLRDVASKLKGKFASKRIFPSHLEKIASGIERLSKLVALRRGLPTSRTATVSEPAIMPTPEEQAIMDLARTHGGLQ